MIKPIRTSTDLAQAKSRLGELLRANQIAHDDEIEVLSTLIEQFERTKVHIDAPSPIGAIRFRMDAMGLTPRQLEPFIGSRGRVSEVLSGKRQLSIDMIRSLHEGLGIPYESLISNRSTNASIESVSTPTIDRLRTLGFDVDREKIPAFFSTISEEASLPLTLRRKSRTQRAVSKTDQATLLLWQAAILKKSETHKLATMFNASVFSVRFLRTIALLSRRSDGPIRAVRALAEHGIATVVLPPLPGTFLDGAALVGSNGNPVIGLTLRYNRLDSFWFTLLHEAAHIALHYDQLLEPRTVFVDDMEIRSEDKCECEADELARESFIPSQILSQVCWDESTTQDEIVNLAIRARVHVSIAAGRWQRDHQNYKKFARLIERGTIRAQIGGGSC